MNIEYMKSIPEAANLLGCHRQTLWQAVKDKKVTGYKVSKNAWLIDLNSAKKWWFTDDADTQIERILGGEPQAQG